MGMSLEHVDLEGIRPFDRTSGGDALAGLLDIGEDRLNRGPIATVQSLHLRTPCWICPDQAIFRPFDPRNSTNLSARGISTRELRV